MIKAHEIQGVLALENSLNRVGLDDVLFVKVATTAVVAKMLGGTKEEITNALSHAWIDNSSLRTYRHAPNTDLEILGCWRCHEPWSSIGYDGT